MEHTNRNGVDLLSIRAGMYIVYQIGTQTSPKITTVVNIRKNNRLEPTGFNTPAGLICATYVIGFAYPYQPPKSRERYGVETQNGAIATVFKRREDAESHVERFGGRVIVFREVAYTPKYEDFFTVSGKEAPKRWPLRTWYKIEYAPGQVGNTTHIRRADAERLAAAFPNSRVITVQEVQD